MALEIPSVENSGDLLHCATEFDYPKRAAEKGRPPTSVYSKLRILFFLLFGLFCLFLSVQSERASCVWSPEPLTKPLSSKSASHCEADGASKLLFIFKKVQYCIEHKSIWYSHSTRSLRDLISFLFCSSHGSAPLPLTAVRIYSSGRSVLGSSKVTSSSRRSSCSDCAFRNVFLFFPPNVNLAKSFVCFPVFLLMPWGVSRYPAIFFYVFPLVSNAPRPDKARSLSLSLSLGSSVLCIKRPSVKY